jgi:hypothetical protein
MEQKSAAHVLDQLTLKFLHRLHGDIAFATADRSRPGVVAESILNRMWSMCTLRWRGHKCHPLASVDQMQFMVYANTAGEFERATSLIVNLDQPRNGFSCASNF